MRILITNDDGIESEGIVRLAEAAKQFGEVWVVAPDGQRSAMSHYYSFMQPVRLKKCNFPVEGVKAYSCTGTPVDAVRIAVIKLMPERPDYVFSGINRGYNMSHDIQYSATLGAALEGAFLGIHSIAFSQGSFMYNEVVDKYLTELMGEYMNKPLEYNTVWNINFPVCELKHCKGILRDRVVSFDPLYNDDYMVEEISEDVNEYTIKVGRNYEATEGTDLDAILRNYVSVGVVSNIR